MDQGSTLNIVSLRLEITCVLGTQDLACTCINIGHKIYKIFKEYNGTNTSNKNATVRMKVDNSLLCTYYLHLVFLAFDK